MEELKREIKVFAQYKGALKISLLCDEFSLRGKDVVSLFRTDPEIRISAVQWIRGVPLQIVTEEDYLFTVL